MRRFVTTAICTAALVCIFTPAAWAQLDYRNLDRSRPLWSEDAWPVERRSLEALLSSTGRFGGGSRVEYGGELSWGAWDNLMISLGIPITGRDDPGAAWLRFPGPELSALYNFGSEGRALPAVALRADAFLPFRAGGGDPATVTLKGIATRTLGRERVHLNLAWTPTTAGAETGAEFRGRWAAAVALDRTAFRASTLLAAELVARDGGIGEPTRYELGAGVRWQSSPTLVVDLGLSRALERAGDHPWRITAGLTRSLGVGRGGKAASPAAGQTVRAEWRYLPGRFNWEFLHQYPEAARLFNAFDYGHAVLYERLWTDPASAVEALETTEFDFLTRDLLIRPPRFPVAEDVIEPSYARVALEAKRMFEWAHLLHRQIYDVYADERLTRPEQKALVERLTDDYLSRSALAFTDQPKAMSLMDEQEFSQYFRRAFPRMNGLIWAYHWLQIGLYEPLMQETTPSGKKAGIADALGRFWAMADSAPSHFPSVMPMATAVAPTFSAAHPRAAAIFDNLHMMHDIISDILANPSVPRARKAELIRAQLAEFRNPTTNLMGLEHWQMMGEMMGGVERMGGVAGRRP